MEQRDTSEQPERRTQILEAALKVFSTKGFHKATNKDIAEAAGGISPGLIYWYFKDKQDLLMSLIQQRMAIFQLTEHPEQLMELPPREALAKIGGLYLSMARAPGNAAFMRVVIGEAVRFPQIGELFYKRVVGRVIGLISQYLQRQIELGHLRPHDPMIAARSFIGMFVVHIIARELLRQPEALAASDEQLTATSVDIFLRGMEIEPGD